jgi:hypothetical protein
VREEETDARNHLEKDFKIVTLQWTHSIDESKEFLDDIHGAFENLIEIIFL